MWGPTWSVAPLSTPTWSFDCHQSSGDAWSVGFAVRRNIGSEDWSWGYSFLGHGHAPNPFSMIGWPYDGGHNPGHVPTGYIMVTNWSFDTNNYVNVAYCDKPQGKAIDASAAAAGTVSGKEENGRSFVYSTRVQTVPQRNGTRHLFVTRPLDPSGVTDASLSCPRGMQILRAFSHVGYYTSRVLDDRAEASQRVRESRTTLDEHVNLHDRPGETDVVALARDKRAIVYQDIHCGPSS